MSARTLATGVTKREVWAWAMYDFANSGYTTVVITAIFNAYFVAVVAGNAPWATFAWTLALSASYALIMLTAPLIGAHADARAAKKRWLLATTVGCVLGTAGLMFAGPGALALAVVTTSISVSTAPFFLSLASNEPAVITTAFSSVIISFNAIASSILADPMFKGCWWVRKPVKLASNNWLPFSVVVKLKLPVESVVAPS